MGIFSKFFSLIKHKNSTTPDTFDSWYADTLGESLLETQKERQRVNALEELGKEKLFGWQHELIEAVVISQYDYKRATQTSEAKLESIGSDHDGISISRKILTACSSEDGSIIDLLGKWFAAAIWDDLVLYAAGKEDFSSLHSAMTAAFHEQEGDFDPLDSAALRGSLVFNRGPEKFSWKASDETNEVLNHQARLFDYLLKANEDFWKNAIFTSSFFDEIVYSKNKDQDVELASDRRAYDLRESETQESTTLTNTVLPRPDAIKARIEKHEAEPQKKSIINHGKIFKGFTPIGVPIATYSDGRVYKGIVPAGVPIACYESGKIYKNIVAGGVPVARYENGKLYHFLTPGGLPVGCFKDGKGWAGVVPGGLNTMAYEGDEVGGAIALSLYFGII